MNTFLFNMLIAIIGIASLTGVLLYFIVDILRGKKSLYSWFILLGLFGFLGLSIQQILSF
ncbi:hypothetical protein [Lysinibacillus sp. 54212]|uniref:hypothetical protein n=1 Tax=Lysinibacillus sp. 54212 TaxID=3119829 RepID=UPI002FC8A2A8